MVNQTVTLQESVKSHLVCRAGGKNELAVRVKRQAVDLRCVGVDGVAGFGGVVRPSVPTEEQSDTPWMLHLHTSFQSLSYFHTAQSYLHHELLVICDRSKEGLVKQVPGHVLDHSGVTSEYGLRIDDLALFWHGADVPQTDGLFEKRRQYINIHQFTERLFFLHKQRISCISSYMIIRRAQQRARQVWIPGETIAFLLMTPETQIRTTFSRRVCGGKYIQMHDLYW